MPSAPARKSPRVAFLTTVSVTEPPAASDGALEASSDGGATLASVDAGGALAANPMIAAGLIRIGEAAQRIIDGDASRALAHATSGPCLQQNLVCVMEAA